MAIDFKNRKVLFFRTHIDPGIGPMPKNAIHVLDMKLEAELLPMGIYVKLLSGEEHIVPYANCQTIKLQKQEVAELDVDLQIDPIALNEPIKRRGRQAKLTN